METAHDLLASLVASTSDVSKSKLGSQQDCYDRVKISLFFDGTGNNRDADESSKKWSNVSRLYDSSRKEPQNGIYAYYISGIGTKLNRKEPWWKIYRSLRDGGVGLGTGWGADSRLESGDMDMSDMLKRALQVAADKASKDVKAIYDANQSKSFDELSKALSNHRLIKSIEVSVFGFSRGAALARAFVNRLLKLCERKDGQLKFQTYPITFRFLGIFDTVASFGLPAKNDFKAIDLWLPADVQRCVHYISGHELRYSFPVDLIRQNGGYQGNWTEEVFPGVHSDVGGGYTPGNQGRSDSLARVPLCGMFREATINGVRLLDWKDIIGIRQTAEKFLIPDETQNLYDSYMSILGATATSGTVEQRMHAHMKQLYAYKRTVTGIESPDDEAYKEELVKHQQRIDGLNNQIRAITSTRGGYSDKQRQQAIDLAKQRNQEQDALDDLKDGKKQIDGGQATIADEAQELREKQRAGKPLELGKVGAAGVYMFTSKAEAWMLDAYDNMTCSYDSVKFFDTLVHDSKAGFLGGHEPYAYFRNRGVWESAHDTTEPTAGSRQAGEIQRAPGVGVLNVSSAY